jgi:hypothetical protein
VLPAFRRVSSSFRLLLPLLLVAGAAVAARAQSEQGPSLGASYEFGVPNSIDRTRNLVNLFAASGGGLAYDYTVRGGIEMAADPFGIGRAVALRLSVGGSTGQYHSVPFLTSAGVRREYVVDVSTLLLGADLRLVLPLTSGWSLDPGAWITYRASGDYVESLNNLDPGATPFDNGAQSIVVARGDTLGASRVRFGLLLASRFTLPLSSLLLVTPEIYSRIDLPAIGLGIRALSVGAGLAFRLRGRADAAPVDRAGGAEDRDRLVRSSEKRSDSVVEARSDSVAIASAPDAPARMVAPQLSASVDLRAVDADGTVRQAGSITAELEFRHLTVVLPPVIRLDPTGLDTSRIASAERALFVDSSQHAVRDVCLDVVLDELGARLQRDSSAAVVLRGAAPRLGAARALLARRWGVGESRVSAAVRRGSDSTLDLMPAPGHAGLFVPVDREWLARAFRVPHLDIAPEITSSAGVRWWRVRVRQGDRIIGGSSMEGAAADMLALDLPDNGADSAIAPLVAELVVEDSAGSVVTARDTLPLRLVDQIDVNLSPERLVWKVVLPSGSCRSCTDSLAAMLKIVAAGVQARDRIVIGEIPDAGAGEDVGKMQDVARRLSTLLRARSVMPGSLVIAAGDGGERGTTRPADGDAGDIMITIVRSVE